MADKAPFSHPTMTLQPPSDFRFDQTRKEWTLVEDVVLIGNPKLQLATFLLEGESSIDGYTILERAKKMGDCVGQHHAERMLDQEDNIPKGWRVFELLFFGTIWRDKHGHPLVPYLYHKEHEWNISWGWLNNKWGIGARLVRLSK